MNQPTNAGIRNRSVKALVQNIALAVNSAYVARRKSRRWALANEEKFYDSFFDAADLYGKWAINHQFKLSRRPGKTTGKYPAIDFVVHDMRLGSFERANKSVTFRGGTLNAFEVALPTVTYSPSSGKHSVLSLEAIMKGDDDKLESFHEMLEGSEGLKALLPRSISQKNIDDVIFENVCFHPFWIFTGPTHQIYQSALHTKKNSKNPNYETIANEVCDFFSNLKSRFHPVAYDGQSIWGVHSGVPIYGAHSNSIYPPYKDDSTLKDLPTQNCFSTIVVTKQAQLLDDTSLQMKNSGKL